MTTSPHRPPLRVVVLISGRGSNLKAIIDYPLQQAASFVVVAVISNRVAAPGLQLAQTHQIPTQILDHQHYTSRAAYDKALAQCIDQYQPDVVVLAGFMRLLTPAFVDHYQGRLINIHPSLLPALRGLNTHQRALDEGLKEHGASVHFVTAELDSGPVIAQAKTAISDLDNAESLTQRVLTLEHSLYPTIIEWIAQGRVILHDNAVYLDGARLEHPVLLAPPLNQASHA